MEIQELIADTRAAIAEYEKAAAALAGLELVAGYIVKCQGVYLTFSINSQGQVYQPQMCQPHKARSFTRRDAQRVAHSVWNGNQAAGEVIHVRDAIAEALAGQRSLLTLALNREKATSI